MPPFGIEYGNLQLQSSSTFLVDSVDLGPDRMGPEDLKLVLERLEATSVPAEVPTGLRDLFARASRLGDKVREDDSYHRIMTKAVDGTIRRTLTEILDQVTVLLATDGENSTIWGRSRAILAALTTSSIFQVFQFFDELDSVVSISDMVKLEPFLQALQDMQEEECQPIGVGCRTRMLTFEFRAGPTDSANISADGLGTLPLQANVTPILVVSSDEVSNNDDRLPHEGFSDCKVKIDSCSHKQLFTSSRSGVSGEALIRVHINPEKEANTPTEEIVWSLEGEECNRLGVVEVRATQTNAFSRRTQTELDLFISSIHGLNGFSVTMRMRTYQSVNDEIPNMDIQLIMRPPSLQS